MATATIGLITYHAAYNFGSTLQTYATIYTLEKLGYSVETIDYRTKSQEFWYKTDFSLKKNKREIINNFGFLFTRKARKEREKKFEDFIKKYLHPTHKTFSSYLEIETSSLNYPILISGSDQIWNDGCGEFRFEPSSSILPYFLAFGTPKKRIAYASSFGCQPISKIEAKKELLSKYDYLSTREPSTKFQIEEVTKKDVTLVCDPTWLLNKEEWDALPIGKLNSKHPYILVYVLNWTILSFAKWMPHIKKMAKKLDYEIYCISPLAFYADPFIHMVQDAGPIDFLSYLKNASLIITNSFHGTIFSMNFDIPFYSCNVTPESRQGQLLKLCGLENRAINSPKDMDNISGIKCDFTYCKHQIEKLREISLNYLTNALQS